MTRNDFTSQKPAPTSRNLKVGETLRHALSEIFLRGETHDPIIDSASITVSEVRTAPDLRNATAYIMPLAGGNKDLILQTLTDLAPRLRYLLSQKVKLRYMPKIHFKLDVSFEEAQKVNRLLYEARLKDEE